MNPSFFSVQCHIADLAAELPCGFCDWIDLMQLARDLADEENT